MELATVAVVLQSLPLPSFGDCNRQGLRVAVPGRQHACMCLHSAGALVTSDRNSRLSKWWDVDEVSATLTPDS